MVKIQYLRGPQRHHRIGTKSERGLAGARARGGAERRMIAAAALTRSAVATAQQRQRHSCCCSSASSSRQRQQLLSRAVFARVRRRFGSSDDQKVHSSSADDGGSNYSADAYESLERLANRIRHMNSMRRPGASLSSSTSKVEKATLRDFAFRLFEQYPRLGPIRAGNVDEDGGQKRKAILRYLAVDCAPNDGGVNDAVEQYRRSSSPQSWEDTSPDIAMARSQAAWRLRQACTPEYERIVRVLMEQQAVAAMQLLLAIRDDIQQWLPWLYAAVTQQHHQQQRRGMEREPASEELLFRLKQLDAYLQKVFSTWFSPGMLEVRRITYDGTPAACIEIVAKQEAVHPMRSLDDLRNRLGPDRRVFGLFHPLLPNQPLVVLHVSLQPEIPSSMEKVHSFSSVKNAKVATFYSISNLQSALSGVGLGEFLIKEAVERIRSEFFSVDTFVTLSPLPRFRRWLEDKVGTTSGKFDVESRDLIGDHRILERLASELRCEQSEALPLLVQRLAAEGPDSFRSLPDDSIIREAVMRLAARYVVREKHHRKPLDGVARFHMANGAEVYRVNWFADPSPKGWRNSFGVMMNYRYTLDRLHGNLAQYETDYSIPVGTLVKDLLPEEERVS